MGLLRYIFILCLGSILFLLSELAHAGAWTLEPKSRQIISTTIIDSADSVFGPDIGENDDPNFSKFESGLYIEQGLTSRVTLVGQSSYQTVSFNNGVEQINFDGFGNTSLGVRYGAYRTDKQVFSFEIHGVLNGGGEDVPDGDLGRGGVSVELRGLYGRNIKVGNKSGFFDVQLGVRSRFNGDPTEWRSDATAGLQLSEKILVLGQGFYMQNDGTLRDPFDPVFPTKSLKGQISAVYWIRPKYGLQFGAVKTLWGENVVDEEAIILGLWQKF